MGEPDDRLASMAGPAADHSVVPFYAQVELFDPSASDPIPLWTERSLEQGVSASPSGLSILTRSDFERGAEDLARVRVRVWLGRGDVRPSGVLVFEGELRAGGEGVMVGSVVGNDLHRVAVPRGDHRVRVHVEPRDAPELVDVVLEDLKQS
jgi:hypothetical protein